MVSALLILMIGFVGGVAITVALGVGLYKLLSEAEVDGGVIAEAGQSRSMTAPDLHSAQDPGPGAAASSYPVALPQEKGSSGFPWEPRWTPTGTKDWRS